jgi:hypothetical protein
MIRSLLTSLLVGCLELVGSSLGAELDSATCLQLGFNPAKVKQEILDNRLLKADRVINGHNRNLFLDFFLVG